MTTTADSDDAEIICHVSMADSITLAMSMQEWENLTPAQRIELITEHIKLKIQDCGGIEGYLDHALNRITPYTEKKQ